MLNIKVNTKTRRLNESSNNFLKSKIGKNNLQRQFQPQINYNAKCELYVLLL